MSSTPSFSIPNHSQFLELAAISSEFYMYTHHIGDKLHNYLAKLLSASTDPTVDVDRIREKMLVLISFLDDELKSIQLKHSNRLIEFLHNLPLYSQGQEQISELHEQCGLETTCLEQETENRHQREAIFETALFTSAKYPNRMKRDSAIKKVVEEIKILIQQEDLKRQSLEIKQKQLLSLLSMSQMTLNTLNPSPSSLSLSSTATLSSTLSTSSSQSAVSTNNGVDGVTSNGNPNQDYAIDLAKQHIASKHVLSTEELTEIFITLMKDNDYKPTLEQCSHQSQESQPHPRNQSDFTNQRGIKRKQPYSANSQSTIHPSELASESL